jgi:hypothetical protein
LRRRALGLLATLAPWLIAVSCADATAPTEGAGAELTARGVTIEVPAGDGTLRARGDRLELSSDRDQVVLRGDAGIALDGPSRIEARADRLRLVAEGPVVDLDGRVRAMFELPGEEAGDAGL